MRATHPLLRYAQRTFDYGEAAKLPWYHSNPNVVFAAPGFYDDSLNRVLYKVGVPGSSREDDRARVEVVYTENPAYRLGRLSSKMEEGPEDSEEFSFHDTVAKKRGLRLEYLTYDAGEDHLRRLKAANKQRVSLKEGSDSSDSGSGSGGMNWFLPVGIGLAAIGAVVGAVYWRKSKA